MIRTRKQRSPQSPLEQLAPDQHARLVGWLKDRANTYKKVVALLREEAGVSTSESALGGFYQRHAAEIVGRKPLADPVPAAGVSVSIVCVRLGEIKLAVFPLQRSQIEADDADTTVLRAGGVEIFTQCAEDGSIKLGVFPVPMSTT